MYAMARSVALFGALAGLMSNAWETRAAEPPDGATGKVSTPIIAAAAVPAGIAERAAFGSLRGVTMAPGGFSLGAVNVVIHSLTGSSVRQLVSDSDGVFRADNLAPGAYEIEASKEGFKKRDIIAM